jgi:hypothetical protein
MSGTQQVYNMVATQTLAQPGFDQNGDPIMVTFNAGDVVSRIVWDGVTPYTPPAGTELVLASD